jgi:asparagine synthetase B (glutamine-hydrolysing)
MLALKKAIETAVLRTDGGALFFSGGLDSSLIAKILRDNRKRFRCFTSGLPNSKDLAWAKKAAGLMNLEIELIEINDYEKLLDEVFGRFSFKNAVDLSIAVPFFASCRKSRDYSINGITGLGADEAFAGYGSHRRVYPDMEKVQDECRKRLLGVKDDLKRDRQIAACFGMELSTPFLDRKVLEMAMEIPAERKINEKSNKIILREIAKQSGVPEEIAERKKTAFQYGSSSMKMLKKTLRERGFKTISQFFSHKQEEKII